MAANPTFGSFDTDQIEILHRAIKEVRQVDAGTYLVREGEPAEAVFIVETGRLEVLRRSEVSLRTHRLAVLEPGMSVGGIALLDRGPRSASVRALESSRVLVIPIRDLERTSTTILPIDAQLKIALGHELATHMRTTNDATIQTLHEKAEEAELRAEMGRFMCRVLIGTCLYMFALNLIRVLARYLPDTTMVTVPILFVFAIGLFINIKTSSFPTSAYGFTTRNWQAAVREAILFSLPVAGIIVLAKWILVHAVPEMAGQPVFDFYRSKGVSTQTAIMAAAGYALFAPIQEMIARSGMQSSFMLFLTIKHKTIVSIMLSTLLFSSTHLHISLLVALLVFPLGLFWGWLYSRNTTLIGVSLSHVALGLFGLFVVGFPTR